MIQAAIFDLDGTLVDSLPGIASSLNRALASCGYEGHDVDAVRTFIGNGSWMLCRRGVPASLPDSEADLVNQSFMKDYNDTWKEGTELFPGISDLLAELKLSGMPLAVLSNKPHPFTADIVSSLFEPGTFDKVLGHRQGTEPKPDPAGALEIASKLGISPTAISFVGDSLVDLETARNAEMEPLLVSWGYRPIDELRSSGAALVDSATEVLNRLRPLD
ncbi:HAD family hydrolase [Haloferula sp.]|uniref:HAD family hydrolase n=1 Tax=Haloferula sp. TaxID=2497595 RepID=UPI00329B7E86